MASLQNSMPVQAIVWRRKALGRARSWPVQLGGEGLGAVLRHVEDDHLLLGGRAHPAGAVPGGEVGDHVQQVAVDAADLRREPDVVVPVALRVDADVVADASPRGAGGGPSGSA